MATDNVRPIIIKKKKIIQAGGHHGGAWKVAYADFVTAMMAFFMLMWLLNATTEKQRKGIADYFSPTVPVARISGGGDGSFGGDSVFSEESLARNGTGASGDQSSKSGQTEGGPGGLDPGLSEVESMLTARAGESMVSDGAFLHIITRVTDEGLVIELFDRENAHLFLGDTAQPSPLLVEILEMMAGVFALVPNEIAVQGHTRSVPVVVQENQTWVQSVQRADRVRAALELNGVKSQRLQRITGFADRELVSENPTSVRNNRIEVILLRNT